jgi:enoyl-[acyl-carrier-protein] reductase (NADH)
VRVVCLRPDAIPGALAEAHSRDVFAGVAARAGTTIEAMLAGRAEQATLLKRLPTLEQVAEVAAFVASNRAAAMTGTVANLSCSSIVD